MFGCVHRKNVVAARPVAVVSEPAVTRTLEVALISLKLMPSYQEMKGQV